MLQICFTHCVLLAFFLNITDISNQWLITQENKYAEIRARVTLDLDFRGEMHVVSYDITGNPFQPLSHNLARNLMRNPQEM